MKYIHDYSDGRQKAWCIHCGVLLNPTTANRDHVPSKTLLQSPRPEFLPSVEICTTCNEGFSRDEEYFSVFLRCCIVNSTDPGDHADGRIARALRRHTKLRADIEASKSTTELPDGDLLVTWEPDGARIRRIVEKNARGHTLYELGEPMLAAPSESWARPLLSLSPMERNEFEAPPAETHPGVAPEVGSRLMMRAITGQDLENDWIVVQEGVYRYRVDYVESVSVKSVLFEYLATEVRWNE